MSKPEPGTKVLSQHGQAGIVCRPTSPLWPTLTPVQWVGTSFLTYVDHRTLEIVELPAGDVPLVAESPMRRFSADRRRREKSKDDHAALLDRARQRGMVRA